MSEIITAPINYAVIAGGNFVSGGAVVFGVENVKPDAANPATLKSVYLDSALLTEAQNPQPLNSSAVFNQATNGALYGADNDKYSIVIYDRNGAELSYIPSYNLSDANAALDAQQSASEAAASAGEAAASETNAKISEDAAEASLNEFVDQYWGAYATEPALSPIGNPATVGDLYFNTTDNSMKVYDGAVWGNVGSSVNGLRDEFSISNVAGQDTFLFTYDPDYVDVFYNGVKLLKGIEYDASSGTQVVLATPVKLSTDVINAVAYNNVDFINMDEALVTARGTTESRALADRFADVVNVKDFGAVGDGITDDTVAVQAAHTRANLLGSSISYSGLVSIAIQADAGVPVNTDTDFCGCLIKPLNGFSALPLSYGYFPEMFVIEDPDCPVITASGSFTSGELKQKSTTPTRGVFDGEGLAFLECSAVSVPDRDKTGLRPYNQSFNVISDGVSTLPLSADLEANAASCTLEYRKASKDRVSISNIRIDVDGSWNQLTFFQVNRCKVDFNGVTVNMGDLGDTISRVIFFYYAADVSISKLTGAGLVGSTAGTYLFETDKCADLRVSDSTSLENWPVMATSSQNGFYVDNCNFSRVDGHDSIHNIYVTNTTLTNGSIQFGWGGGDIFTDGVRVYDSALLRNRTDWGGHWIGGSVSLNNTIMENSTGQDTTVIDFQSTGLGAASMATNMPDSISVDGIETSADNGWNLNLILSGAGAGVVKPTFTKSIKVSNVTAKNKSTRTSLRLEDFDTSAGLIVKLRSLDVEDLRVFSTMGLTLTDMHTSDIYVSDIQGDVTLQTNNSYYKVDVSKCRVVEWVSEADLYSTFNDCYLRNLAGDEFGSANFTVGIAENHIAVRDTYISGNFDLSNVDMFSGCVVRASATVPTLPAGATYANLLAGWVRPGKFEED